MITDFVKSFYYYFEGLSILTRPGFRSYFVYSGLIGIVVMALCFFIIKLSYISLGNFLSDLIPWEMAWLDIASDWVSFGGMLVIFFSMFKYLMLIITAPLMSQLSEKIESYLENDVDIQTSSSISWLKELGRGLLISVRNIFRELFFTLILLLMSIIPGLGILSSPLILVVQGYYAGFGIFDFWAERHYSYNSTVKYMKSNKGMLIGNGIVYVILIAIPIIGVFLAPPLATAAATLQAHKRQMSYV